MAALVALAALALVAPGLGVGPAGAAPAAAGPRAAVAPDQVLPPGWRSSPDVAWTTSGDAGGFHLLVAEARTGYAWRTAATLSEPRFETDQWVGQACLTGSGRRAVVVYAPRQFTNRQPLFDRGAFAAVVDLASGQVRKLEVNVSLAYFDPGCGVGETAVLTQAGDVELGKTRLHLVDAAAGAVVSTVTVAGQLTSAVPDGDRIVGALGASVVRVGRNGAVRRLARASGVPLYLHPDGDGGIVFLDRSGTAASAQRLVGTTVRTLGRGRLGALRVRAGTGGRVFLVGSFRQDAGLPRRVERVDAPVDAEVSSTGALAVTRVTPEHLWGGGRTAGTAQPGTAQRVRLRLLAAATGRTLDVTVDPLAGGTLSAGQTGTAGALADPVDGGRACAVPRNDPRTQVYQPHWRQVEWAADLAVQGALTVGRPENWKQSGLPAWSPQGMFPPVALAGGGRVPAQILLGVLAQESNLWQASGHALEGVTGNPLVANFYGADLNAAPSTWTIDWANADCGYGVAQVTDGMLLGDPLRSATQQRTIALDYAANIAAGLQVLQQKWNQTYNAGLRVSNADPSRIENWFYAVWAYNSGFHPDLHDGSPWGVGWFNNPVNPRYPADRPPFLETSDADASHPQDWPYPEKVVGWAAYPIAKDGGNDRGYVQAWWTTDANRTAAKPPVAQFCDTSNACYPGQLFQNDLDEPPGPCSRRDLECWYHQASTWKADCTTTCGHESLRFATSDPEPPDATNYPPDCASAGLPAGALLIDDVPDSVPSVRPGCSKWWSSAGTFDLTFAGDANGGSPARIDFHQIGAGFGAHFWFAHTRKADAEGLALQVTGTWTLGRQVNGWARVLVHLPDHGAHTQQARYDVDLGNGTVKHRVLLQRTMSNRWVSLGALPFAGTPKVSLSTITADGDGSEDVAWDAIAFQLLPGKPRDIVVALGDSYSSGEGASDFSGSDYYAETDNNGDNAYRNACHRSPYAWSRKAVLADSTLSIGSRADSWDSSTDYHLVACSGAETENLLPPTMTNAFGRRGQGLYRELSQSEWGYLDESTTLVTLSVGGNDSRFRAIIEQCIYGSGLQLCQDTQLPGDSAPLRDAEPELMRTKVKDSVATVLQAVHQRAPNATIVLAGYPRPLEAEGQCIPGIGTEEAPWLNGLADYLDDRLAEAVAAARAGGVPVWFSDPRSFFAGQAICGSPQTVNAIVLQKTPGDAPGPMPSAQSFHPNTAGTTHYADALDATLRTIGL